MKTRREELHTDSPIQAFIAAMAAEAAARFCAHPRRYKREPTGSYPWFYTGTQLFVYAPHGTFEQWRRTGADINDEIDLTVDGVHIGRAHAYIPFAYPRNFIVIELDETLYYHSETVLRFARAGGFDTTNFDTSLLAIRQFDPFAEPDILVF